MLSFNLSCNNNYIYDNIIKLNYNIPISISSYTNYFKFYNINKNSSYDIIIDNLVSSFLEQISYIKNNYQLLNEGGILVIENINIDCLENNYIDYLDKVVLDTFQIWYFITINKISKYLIFIKNGKSNYMYQNKITIITPSIRPNNLLKIKDLLNFDYIEKWIIVYDKIEKLSQFPDCDKIEKLSQFPDCDKIEEYSHFNIDSKFGNSQRNYALDKVNNNALIYYLDDDNIIPDDFYIFLNIISNDFIYTFDQQRSDRILKGDNLSIGNIDTAMIILPFKLCNTLKWINNLYEADGKYIEECYSYNCDKHIYVNNILSFYNKL